MFSCISHNDRFTVWALIFNRFASKYGGHFDYVSFCLQFLNMLYFHELFENGLVSFSALLANGFKLAAASFPLANGFIAEEETDTCEKMDLACNADILFSSASGANS